MLYIELNNKMNKGNETCLLLFTYGYLVHRISTSIKKLCWNFPCVDVTGATV